MKNILNEINKIRNLMKLPLLESINDREPTFTYTTEYTDNPNSLIQLLTKYQPQAGWFIHVAYINNVKINPHIYPSDELKKLGSEINSPIINDIINSTKWDLGLPFFHNLGSTTILNKKSPSKIYKLSRYNTQWLPPEERRELKAQHDSELLGMYNKYNQNPIELDPKDKRGRGWIQLPYSPFEQHINTKTIKLTLYHSSKIQKIKPKFYALYKSQILELSDDEIKFLLLATSTDLNKKMPKRLFDIKDENIRKILYDKENEYEYRNLNIEKISYIIFTCKIDNKNKKIIYVNENAVPDGLPQGAFKEIIKKLLQKDNDIT